MIVLCILCFTSRYRMHVKTDCIEYIMFHLYIPNKLNFSIDLGNEAKLMVFGQVSPIWPSIVWISLSSHLIRQLKVLHLLCGTIFFLCYSIYINNSHSPLGFTHVTYSRYSNNFRTKIFNRYPLIIAAYDIKIFLAWKLG